MEMVCKGKHPPLSEMPPLGSLVCYCNIMTSLCNTCACIGYRSNTLYMIGLRGGTFWTHLSAVDQSQQSQSANQSEQTGLWCQTEGEKRCCSTGSVRQIKSFLNIKAWRHVPGETLHTNMNLEMNIYILFKM